MTLRTGLAIVFAFLVSELSCGVHAVLAIGEWGEHSADLRQLVREQFDLEVKCEHGVE